MPAFAFPGLVYHNGMNVSSEYDPRANQKQRTRSAIVEAAIALLATGVRPTVTEAAAAAKVSRATAYRYFPTQESLLVEAAASRPVESIDAMLAAQADPADGRGNLASLQSAVYDLMAGEEAAMRMALRAYLDAWFDAHAKGDPAPDVREGRRMRWIAAALGPALAGLPGPQARRLHAGLALTMGVEPLVVMKDVCHLGDDEARDVLRWVAGTLFDAATAGRKK